MNPNPSLRLSDEGAILYANPAAARLLKQIHLDPSHPELLFPSNLRERLKVLANMEMGVDTWEYQIGDRIISCFIHYLPEYRVFHAYLTDVTEARRVEMLLLNRQTNYDSLTGLPNRYLFEERLQDAILTARRERRTGREQIGLFLISLDRFHHVNLTLGREIGDQLLQGMAGRLRQVTKAIGDGMCVRPYRYQGDIFAIKAPDLSCLGEPNALVEILLEHMKATFHCGGQGIFMTASIGISLYPLDSQDSTAMVQNAETAMFEAKMSGETTFATTPSRLIRKPVTGWRWRAACTVLSSAMKCACTISRRWRRGQVESWGQKHLFAGSAQMELYRPRISSMSLKRRG